MEKHQAAETARWLFRPEFFCKQTGYALETCLFSSRLRLGSKATLTIDAIGDCDLLNA
jgi:hypothetical protein